MKTLRSFLHAPDILALLLAASLLAASTSRAQWSVSPGKNTPVCTAPGDQTFPSMVTDGSGGAIIAWNDMRGSSSAVYVQKLDAGGSAVWPVDGVPLCSQQPAQESVLLVSDGQGGAIAVWRDYRSMDTVLYCQRMNGSGAIQWNLAGIAIVSVRRSAVFQAISDGARGVVVVWEDRRNGNPDIYAQRISPDGSPLWAGGGVPVCADTGAQSGPSITVDGTGGVVCSWTDSRPGGIYAQRLDGNGLPKWLAGGVAVIPSLPVRTVGPPTIASDRASGAVVVNYTRFGSGPRMVCAERIDSSGVTGWVDTLDQTSELQQGNIRMVSSGPLVTTFSVYVHGGVFHYGTVSCVDTSGTILWQQNPFAQGSDILAVAGDNGGGVFLLASVSPVGGPFGFSVQHITGAGTTTWAGGGIDVDTTSSSSWPSDPVLIPDGAGGLIAAWQQDRSGSIDIFAQRVDVSGALPIRLSAFAAKTVAPGSIQLTWTTLTEVNCYGFDIQKAGAGSQAYRTVPGSFTPGEGTTLLAHAYAFTDLHAEPGTWLYRLEEIDRDGTRRYSEPVLAADGSVPASFSLAQNYPNPFNPGTTIRYALPEKSHVTLSVFNALGQHVVTLLEETQGAGFHEVKFDGSGLPSGAYFYRVQAGGFSGTKKGLLIR